MISKVVSYQESTSEPTLSGFLEEVALVADIDSLEEESDYVILMTLHSAKGLEFPYVYLTGMEEGVFPGYASVASEDSSDLEEERRLCYVGITRAMRHLTLTCAKMRMIRGETHFNRVSRFVTEIPQELFGKEKEKTIPKQETVQKASTPYQQARESFHRKSFDPKQFKVTKADHLDYTVGDTVKHIKFGMGTVLEILDGGKDFEVTVDFERFGVKKMFAAFAKLQKC